MPEKKTTPLEAEGLRHEPGAILEERLPSAWRAGALRGTDAGERVGAAEPKAPAQPGQGGILVLPIKGTILPKASMGWAGDTGLDLLRAQLHAAAGSDDVAAILLDVDSPGGMVDGLEETAALLREVRKHKPVVAHADSLAASAAYYLMAQAGDVVAGSDAFIGSIGTLMVHGDFSGMFEQAGIKVSIVRNPPRKAEGGPMEPLSDEARARFQAIVDTYSAQFQADVAKGRGVSAATVRADYGQGLVLMAREALAAGLVDRIESMEGTLARMLKGKRASRVRQEGEPVLVLAADGESDPLQDVPQASSAARQADQDLRERARALELDGA